MSEGEPRFGDNSHDFIDKELKRVSANSDEFQPANELILHQQAMLRAEQDIARIVNTFIDGNTEELVFKKQLDGLRETYPELSQFDISQLLGARLEAKDEPIQDPDLAHEVANASKPERDRLEHLMRAPLSEFHAVRPGKDAPMQEKVGAVVNSINKMMDLWNLSDQAERKEREVLDRHGLQQLTDEDLREQTRLYAEMIPLLERRDWKGLGDFGISEENQRKLQVSEEILSKFLRAMNDEYADYEFERLRRMRIT